MVTLLRMAAFIFFVPFLLNGCAAIQGVKGEQATGAAIANKVIIKYAGFHEDCVVLKKGQVLVYKFRATQPVDFNIHYHLEDGIQYPVSQSEVTGFNGTFDPEKSLINPSGEEIFCMMWENKDIGQASLSYEYEVKAK